jgi:hypothetical protein
MVVVRRYLAAVTIMGLSGAVGGTPGEAQIVLRSFEEVISATQGAVFSTGSGVLTGSLSPDGTSAQYTLTYTFPDPTPVAGSQYVNEAHLHFGQAATQGGAIVYLCFSEGNAALVPAGTPPCPSPSGSVSGTLTASSVIGPAAQGIEPGDFSKLVQAVIAGAVYVNVHTDRFPAGEIRGQLPRAQP